MLERSDDQRCMAELDVPYRMSERIKMREGWENKMERIQGLKEYVQTEHYLEGIGIGKEEQKEIQIAYQHWHRANIISTTGSYTH